MKALTHEGWMKNPTPRMMWVWDEDETHKKKRKVIYVSEYDARYPVIVLSDSDVSTYVYIHCAEIEKREQRRMTNKELARWLREKPHRELKMSDYIYHDYDYKENEQDAEVTDSILIRENDSEWREPLVEQ